MASKQKSKHSVPDHPTADLIRKHLDRVAQNERYAVNRRAVESVFKRYPKNTSREDILIKACVLNALYSTNVGSLHKVADHILAVEFDEHLKEGNKDVVNKIAKVNLGDEKSRNFYSFASKYCHFHNPDFPIYDYFVCEVLARYQLKDFFTEKQSRALTAFKKQIKEYPVFCDALGAFVSRYDLKFSLKEIDQFLWNYGKELYPRHYGKKE